MWHYVHETFQIMNCGKGPIQYFSSFTKQTLTIWNDHISRIFSIFTNMHMWHGWGYILHSFHGFLQWFFEHRQRNIYQLGIDIISTRVNGYGTEADNGNDDKMVGRLHESTHGRMYTRKCKWWENRVDAKKWYMHWRRPPCMWTYICR